MRTKTLLKEYWRFHEGDIALPKEPIKKGIVYNHAKAEAAVVGPAARFYEDNNDWCPYGKLATTDDWVTVSIPHDYVIDKKPEEKYNEGYGFFKTENAWYRRKLKLAESDRGKRIVIYFEGISDCCNIWVNGCLAKRNYSGFNSFEVDITDYALYGEENINLIAIHIDATRHEGWWYAGGGIYRNVWLIKSNIVSVDTWGVYVAPEKVSDKEWLVPVETTIRNDSNKNRRVSVKNDIVDADGNIVATATSTVNVPLKDKSVLKQKMTVNSPKLWSCEEPNLYYCKTTVFSGNTEIDNYSTHFGFRTIRFDANEGFFLNDKHVMIKGVCCHEDYGLQGKAVFDRIKRYKVKLFKEMGCNGYRTSHYMQSEQTMDELDRQGFLVMNETRWFGTCDEYMEQLEALVKRDRNRPGVIMWSLGNEEALHVTERGKMFNERMAAFVRKLDKTRPVTSAVSVKPLEATVFDSQDIIGINYNLGNLDALHEKEPNKPIFSSENCATGTTRGWYFDSDPKRGFINAYDHDTNTWFKGRENTWRFFMERPWIAGSYQWAAVEHRGEAAWPRLCSCSGALDLFLIKKDAFYQNKSFWSDEPMVHILPHWNFEGHEGEEIPVWAYTNCEQLELIRDGVSLGKKDIEKYSHGEWKLIYEPGEIVVKGYIGGKEVASDRVVTTGKPVALKLEMQTEALFADKNDAAVIHCYCVDENGNQVPDANPLVEFECNSLGTVRATGSSSADHVPIGSLERKMYAGTCVALVCSTGVEGTLKVYAKSNGLKTGKIEIEVTKPNELIR